MCFGSSVLSEVLWVPCLSHMTVRGHSSIIMCKNLRKESPQRLFVPERK